MRLKNITKQLGDILSGNVFGRKSVQKNLKYLGYVTFWIVVYIAYGYYADKTMKEIAVLEDMEEINSELHSEIKELNQISLQSNISKLTEDKGLKELRETPHAIKVEKEFFEKK